MVYDFGGIFPDISKSAFTADSAQIIGDVTLCEGSSVWFNAVLRGDDDKITVGKNSNVQDNCTVHCDKGFPVEIGENVTVGHNAVLHGCTVGDNSLIGMNATILNGAKIGKNCIVGAGALVTENKESPDNSLILGVPAKQVGDIDGATAKKINQNALHYAGTAKKYSL
ncbi:MAG: gamma carbonic anhydrase family protein [Candidatus Fimenecus sp.]